MFLEKPRCGDQKYSSHHWIVAIFWMAIEKIQSPFDTPPPLDGD